MIAWPLVLGLLACQGGVEPSDAEPPAVAAWVPPREVRVQQRRMGAEGQPSMSLSFAGVGSLYRRFFSEDALVEELYEALRVCMSEDFDVLVTYNERLAQGRIVLRAPATGLVCRPTWGERESVDLAPLAAVGRAMTTLRDRVAEAKDLRIYGQFNVGVYLTGTGGSVGLWARGGYPTSGERWAPCVGLNGLQECDANDAKDGLTSVRLVNPSSRRRLGEALAITPRR